METKIEQLEQAATAQTNNADLVDLGGPVVAELAVNYNPVLRPNDELGVIVEGLLGLRESAHPDLKKYMPATLGAIGEETDRGYTFEWEQ